MWCGMFLSGLNLSHDKISELLLDAKTNIKIQVIIIAKNFIIINKTQEEMWTKWFELVLEKYYLEVG